VPDSSGPTDTGLERPRGPLGIWAAMVAVAIGALQTLTFAPFDWWPLGPVSILLLTWLVWYRDRGLFRLGWLLGLGLFGTGASWVYVSIHEFGNTAAPLATFLTSLFVAGLALFPALTLWSLGKLAPSQSNRRLWLLPAVWVLGDWFRSWLLTGFPWLYLGTSQVDGPLAGWAPILGVYGVTLLIAATGTLLFGAWRRLRRGHRGGAVVCLTVMLVPWLCGPLLNRIDWTHPDGKPLRVAAAQGNIPQLIKWNPKFLTHQIQTYLKLTRHQWDRDLILWPETAIPLPQDDAQAIIKHIRRKLGPRSTLLTGIPWYGYDARAGRNAFHNSIMAIGDGSGIYHKQKLVPFGEYVPLEKYLRGVIAFFDLPMSDFTPGPPHQRPLKVDGYRVHPFVCYEIAYPDFVADRVSGTAFIVNISNDGWFGHSLGPLQHLQIVRMRALETRRDILRGTNNGITALINRHGDVVKRAPRFTEATLTGTLTPVKGNTPFMETGSWPMIILSLVLVVLARQRSASR